MERPKRHILREVRCVRRMLRAAGRDFVRDDQGTVMLLTVAFAIPLLVFVFLSFNTGIALVSRMRAQNVADAASYSGALWQARFLNYCAYTRRHIVGNFSTIALCTAYVNSANMHKGVWDADGLTATAHEDSDAWWSIKTRMKPAHWFLEGVNGIGARRVCEEVRVGADHMNKWLSNSQLAMGLAVGVDVGPTIMKKVVDEAAGKQETDYELDLLLSHGSIVASGLLQKDRQEIPIKEVKKYFSTYTKGSAPNMMAGLGRSLYGFWADFGHPPPPLTNKGDPFIVSINIKSDKLAISKKRMKTADHVYPVSLYCWTGVLKWIYPYGVPVPIGLYLPITGDDVKENYKLKTPFTKALVYEVKNRKTPIEPSTLAVVNVKQQTAPFYRGLGLHPDDLYPATPIRAFSRSKVYFRGWQENIKGGKYHGQNLNYPFWGAKLAPLAYGGTLIKGVLVGTLGQRSVTQMPEY